MLSGLKSVKARWKASNVTHYSIITWILATESKYYALIAYKQMESKVL